jgi:transposase
MSMRCQRTAHMVGAATGLHRHNAWLECRCKGNDRLTPHPPANDNPTGAVQTHHAAAVLAEVDPQNRNFHDLLLPQTIRCRLNNNGSVKGRAIHKGGARANAIGISRGGRTTKIHALVDVLGRPLRLVLTPGNTSDMKGADLLIGETVGMKRVIADRGYDANRIRAILREQGSIPVIPGRRNRKRPIQYDERRYKDRWRVEAMFCRLKDFRRIATRYDKLARNFLSAVSLAAAVAFWL